MPDLFPDAPTREIVQPERRGRPINRPRLVPQLDCWTIEDHVCQLCLGRIASAAGPEGRVFMCCDCGHKEAGVLRTAGRIHPTFCACAMKYGKRDAGVRCLPNDRQSPELPQAIVAMQVE